jgi:hypothetical protein
MHLHGRTAHLMLNLWTSKLLQKGTPVWQASELKMQWWLPDTDHFSYPLYNMFRHLQRGSGEQYI